MAEGRACDDCGKTQSEGPWTRYVRTHWPFLVSVCSECRKKHIAQDQATWNALPKKWFCACVALGVVSLGLAEGHEQVAVILPLCKEYNEGVVIGLATLLYICALALGWWTFRRARNRASRCEGSLPWKW